MMGLGMSCDAEVIYGGDLGKGWLSSFLVANQQCQSLSLVCLLPQDDDVYLEVSPVFGGSGFAYVLFCLVGYMRLVQLTVIRLVLPSVLGQSSTPTTFTDPDSGVVFNTWGIPNGGAQTQGGFTFGVALPEDALSTDADEFIGYLVRWRIS